MKSLFFHLVSVVAANEQMRCVFLHGVGTPTTSATSTSDTDGYWGGKGIIEYTPYCSSRFFLHQDTVKRGWDDVDLQQAACDASIGEGGSDNVIRNTIVISHSMGNLFFAGALRRGLCSFDTASSQWISIEAPWLGSKAAPWVNNICSKKKSQRVLRWLATKLHYCDPERPGEVYRSYESLRPTFPGLPDLLKIGSAYVTRSMCGTSPFGLTSPYSAALKALAAEVHFGQLNDGMVAIESCMLPGKTYEKHYAHPHYMSKINHIDGTCRTGNGRLGHVTRQPCLWLAGNQTPMVESVFI